MGTLLLAITSFALGMGVQRWLGAHDLLLFQAQLEERERMMREAQHEIDAEIMAWSRSGLARRQVVATVNGELREAVEKAIEESKGRVVLDLSDEFLKPRTTVNDARNSATRLNLP